MPRGPPVHAQLVAEELGTGVDRVRLRAGDTDAAGRDTGAYGSTGSVVAGSAVALAARQLKEQVVALAGGGTPERHGVRPPDGTLTPYADLLAEPMTATGQHHARPGPWPSTSMA